MFHVEWCITKPWSSSIFVLALKLLITVILIITPKSFYIFLHLKHFSINTNNKNNKNTYRYGLYGNVPVDPDSIFPEVRTCSLEEIFGMYMCLCVCANVWIWVWVVRLEDYISMAWVSYYLLSGALQSRDLLLIIPYNNTITPHKHHTNNKY